MVWFVHHQFLREFGEVCDPSEIIEELMGILRNFPGGFSNKSRKKQNKKEYSVINFAGGNGLQWKRQLQQWFSVCKVALSILWLTKERHHPWNCSVIIQLWIFYAIILSSLTTEANSVYVLYILLGCELLCELSIAKAFECIGLTTLVEQLLHKIYVVGWKKTAAGPCPNIRGWIIKQLVI